MMKYEIKKVFSKTGSKIALLLLAALLCTVCYFSFDVTYVTDEGISEHGLFAARKLRGSAKSGWVCSTRKR